MVDRVRRDVGGRLLAFLGGDLVLMYLHQAAPGQQLAVRRGPLVEEILVGPAAGSDQQPAAVGDESGESSGCGRRQPGHVGQDHHGILGKVLHRGDPGGIHHRRGD